MKTVFRLLYNNQMLVKPPYLGAKAELVSRPRRVAKYSRRMIGESCCCALWSVVDVDVDVGCGLWVAITRLMIRRSPDITSPG